MKYNDRTHGQQPDICMCPWSVILVEITKIYEMQKMELFRTLHMCLHLINC